MATIVGLRLCRVVASMLGNDAMLFGLTLCQSCLMLCMCLHCSECHFDNGCQGDAW